METNSENRINTNHNTQILDNIVSLSANVSFFKDKCSYIRSLLDEGTYKIDAVLNIINGLKVKEQNIVASGGDQAVLQQMSAEQIDSLLEMLRTPAFQSLARQLLTKWVNPTPAPENVNKS